MKLLPIVLLCLVACSNPKEQKVIPKVELHEAPPFVPDPAPTNPFEKHAPPPAPPPGTFKSPHFEQVGGEFKLNDSWSFWTWRDSANNVTCYLYTAKVPDGSGMSCIKN